LLILLKLFFGYRVPDQGKRENSCRKCEKISRLIWIALAPPGRDRETEKINGERGSRRKEKKIKERR